LKVACLVERAVVSAVHDRTPDVAVEAIETGLYRLEDV
jgi:hypothetical protein